MAVTKPTPAPTWATSLVNILTPTSGRRIAGWLPGMAPAGEFHNWWMNLVGKWSEWFDQEIEELRRAVVVDAIAKRFTTGNILSSSHNWNCGAVSDAGSNSLVQPRYWVVGDDGAGNTAIAHSDSAGAAWANDTGSAQAGSLTHAAANGTLCMALGGNNWKLGGSTSAFGTLPFGSTVRGIAYDPVNNLWIAATSGGIYTSPRTVIAWTQRALGNYLGVVHYAGRNYAIKATVATTAEPFTSTDGTTWTAAATFATAVAPERILASSEGVFVVTASPDNKLYRSATFGAAPTFADITPPSKSPAGAFVWKDFLCLPGIYVSHGASAGLWKGSAFTLGVNEVLAGGDHGAIACNAVATAVVFGPTIDLSAVA